MRVVVLDGFLVLLVAEPLLVVHQRRHVLDTEEHFVVFVFTKLEVFHLFQLHFEEADFLFSD